MQILTRFLTCIFALDMYSWLMFDWINATEIDWWRCRSQWLHVLELLLPLTYIMKCLLWNLENVFHVQKIYKTCKPNIYVSWSTSELSVRLAPWNRFKPSSKIFLLTIPRRCFFCGSLVLFMSCVFHAFMSVYWCLVVTCWGRTDLLALVCDV